MKAFKAFLWLLAYLAIYLLIEFTISFIGIIIVSVPAVVRIIAGGTSSLFSSIYSAVSMILIGNTINIINCVAAAISIIVFVIIIKARTKRDYGTPSFSAAPGALNIWSAALLGLFLNFFISYIYGLILSLPALQNASESYGEASALLYQGDIVLQVISVAILSPVLEELLFRGLIMGKLCSVVPGAAAVVLQAAIFASFHSGPVWMSYAFICGIILGWLCLKTHSVYTSMAFHICFNAASFLPQVFYDWNAALFFALFVSLVVSILAITVIHLNNPGNRKDKTENVDI